MITQPDSRLDAGEADEPWLRPAVLPWLLAVLALAALLIRALWIWRYGHVIENEGTVYARLAESLRDGVGYVSMLGDRHTLMPPLYPLLILLVAPVTGSIEMAARIVSCAAGVASIWPVYMIGKTLAGRRAGLIAAALVATHGVAIGFSGATYGEGSFFFLLFSATALLLRAVERPSTRAYLAAGVVYALAYLVRPETVAYLGLAVVFVICYDRAKRRAWGVTVKWSALLVLAFAIVAAPYVTWLSVNSGYFRLEGKSLNNALVNRGMSRGMQYHEAAQLITDDLQPVGPGLITDQFDIPRTDRSGLVLALQTVLFDPIHRGLTVVQIWTSDPSPGGPLLTLLGVVGALAVLLRRRELLVAGLFLGMTCGYVGLILAVRWFDWDRYIYPLTFFALIWAAAGVSAVAASSSRVCASLGGSARAQLLIKPVMSVLLVAAVSVVSLSGNAAVFQESHMPSAETMKAAGLWILAQPKKRPLVMSANAVVPYYAEGDLSLFPWNESSIALRFIHKRRPDYLVLRTAERSHAPYIESWLANGIPDPCAKEIHRMVEEPGRDLVVYRWDCGLAEH